VDNEEGRATGWWPGRLTDQGRTLAARLGERRRDDGIAAVFSSDLTRAAETASVAFGASGIPVLLDRLRLAGRLGVPATVVSMPPESARLTFREMTTDDLDDMALLLGDPEVMTYYPRPKTRDEAVQWIEWNRALYRTHGNGLWLLSTADGGFAGDCGLTPQLVDGVTELEVGYHVLPALQGRGYATEAAAASRDFARDVLGATRLIAIIHPENRPSQRVAEKIGLLPEKRTAVHGGRDAIIYAVALDLQ
jgi:RimJ/RimL family protein N-acetyltransferase